MLKEGQDTGCMKKAEKLKSEELGWTVLNKSGKSGRSEKSDTEPLAVFRMMLVDKERREKGRGGESCFFVWRVLRLKEIRG